MKKNREKVFNTCRNCEYERENGLDYCPKCGVNEWIETIDDPVVEVFTDCEETFKVEFQMEIKAPVDFKNYNLQEQFDQIESYLDHSDFTDSNIIKLTNNFPIEEYPFICSNCGALAKTNDGSCSYDWCYDGRWEKRFD